jgi:hypothetical protein
MQPASPKGRRLPFAGILLLAVLGMMPVGRCRAGDLPPIKTVFVILMENCNWSGVISNSSAPYINNTLLPMASYCLQYCNPPGNHPSLPNYLWLEAGTNFGLTNDADPVVYHQNTSQHLVSQLARAGISWKSYQEDIPGDVVPLTETNLYVARHNPMVFFDDVTGTNDPANAYGIAHFRPYSELEGDLASNRVAHYNFLTPNLCDDMHTAVPPLDNTVLQGDTWLSEQIPIIMASAAYRSAGAIFILWDEGGFSSDGPIGMMVVSPFAKGAGYSNSIPYTHSSTLRTFQEIFSVGPLLGDAANATDLSDLFVAPAGASQGPEFSFSARRTADAIELEVGGMTVGQTHLIQASADLNQWTTVATNLAISSRLTYVDPIRVNCPARFYRVVAVQ